MQSKKILKKGTSPKLCFVEADHFISISILISLQDQKSNANPGVLSMKCVKY